MHFSFFKRNTGEKKRSSSKNETAKFNPRVPISTDEVKLQQVRELTNESAVNVPFVEPSDVHQAGRHIEVTSMEEFSSLPLLFEELVNDLKLGDHLGFTVRPALFGGPRGSTNARIALIVSISHVASDEVKSVLKILSDQNKWKNDFKLWEHSPIIAVPHGLMLALSRGEINKESLNNRRGISVDPKKHGFYRELENIVAFGLKEGASDIHFNLNFGSELSEVRFTIFGRYVAPERFKLPTQTLYQILNVAWMSGTGGSGPSYDVRIEQQCRISMTVERQPIMLRWASASTEYPGPSVTTRIIRSEAKVVTLEDLSYLPHHIGVYNRAINSEKGAIILCGVVNSGKTVTLAALTSKIPDYRKKMSIEDPVEIVTPGMLHKSINRPLEGDTGREFDPIAKTVKRFAINDILIGEVRDKPTGVLMVDVTLMGTSVYATTHAPSHLGVFDKLASDMVGISRDFLSVPGNIKLICYQALIPSLCSCSLPILDLTSSKSKNYAASGAAYIKRIDKLYDLDESKLRIRNTDGCPLCRHETLPQLNGFRGRTLAAEMVEPDESLLIMVKRGDSVGMRRYVADMRGSTRFDDADMTGKSAMECAVYKMANGLIDPREVEPRFHSFEREEMIRESSRRYSEHVEKQVVASLRTGT